MRSTPANRSVARTPSPRSHSRRTSRISNTRTSRETPSAAFLTAGSDGGNRTPSSTAAGGPRVVPSLAKERSHAHGETHLTVVPCSWRATSGDRLEDSLASVDHQRAPRSSASTCPTRRRAPPGPRRRRRRCARAVGAPPSRRPTPPCRALPRWRGTRHGPRSWVMLGATASTRTPYGPSSTAAARVRPTTPCLDVMYVRPPPPRSSPPPSTRC